MRRKTKRKLLSVLAGAAAVLVLFAALFLLGHPGGFDTYIHSAAAKLEAFAGRFEKTENAKVGQGEELRLHFIDVGQADCTRIECGGKFMLVDGGNNGDAALVSDFL